MQKTTLLIKDLNLGRCRWLLGFMLFLSLALCGPLANAQSIIKGKIVDENGVGMPGVNILIKGTASGTTSDSDGAYSLSVGDGSNAVLVVSFIGYITQEIIIGSQTTIDVSLAPSVESLSEVVVVGYGTQKKIDLTGAVASVDLTSFQQAPNTNLGQFMQGTVPGLNVGVATSAGATPQISIRGRVTLGGNQDVLIILDGIQYNGSLSSINPDDIASIDVLKDASSTAVYGAQAANGVILITSKRGKPGKPQISFKTLYTSQQPTVGDFVPNNREQYLAGLTEA
ncbi:MAG TPA: TonB-dependent receptor plug domain-containing protein, partial [Chryseolinea sp.]|nr:TonB-dependent receptor plug domain-containing protein [Chryseolinea sp.]